MADLRAVSQAEFDMVYGKGIQRVGELVRFHVRLQQLHELRVPQRLRHVLLVCRCLRSSRIGNAPFTFCCSARLSSYCS